MSDKILYVDDEPNVLAACQRSLGRKLRITTATSGAEGLEIIRKDGPFAVVLSDMRMPEMDGIEFICAVHRRVPDTVCMMLTGNSDQETAVNAVNKGQIFRFLTKPIAQDVLFTALTAGVEQYRLVTAEKELLNKTLMGSIVALSEVLGLVCPQAFALGNRTKPIARALVQELKPEHAWQYEIAATLSQIGCVVLPPSVIEKVFSGTTLTSEEEEMYASHPKNGRMLLEHIPRLEQSAKMIEFQLERYDASVMKTPNEIESAVVLGSQIIHAAIDFDFHISEGLGRPVAITRMREKKGEYNPRLIGILESASIPMIDDSAKRSLMKLEVWRLRVGMIANKAIVTATGALIVPKGTEITKPMIVRLRNFSNGVGVQEPIDVLVPQDLVAHLA